MTGRSIGPRSVRPMNAVTVPERLAMAVSDPGSSATTMPIVLASGNSPPPTKPRVKVAQVPVSLAAAQKRPHARNDRTLATRLGPGFDHRALLGRPAHRAQASVGRH